jgi:hypothetical protein
VRALPEAPHQERLDGGLAEGDGQEVASVIGLSGFVLRVDVELGDFELFAEGREAIESLQQVIDAGDASGEVALQADTIDGGALTDQVLNGLRVVILMRLVRKISLRRDELPAPRAHGI